ncbi:exo-alpha-sialidase, partial [bacterium]|nr:exo-alpha-sialidase [bacterium]
MRRSIITLIILALSSSSTLAFWSGTEADQLISQDDNFQGWYTRMAVDDNGVIHTVWNERISNLPVYQEIFYSRSADNGRSWSAETQDIIISFDDEYSTVNGADIAIDANNNLYVVWGEADTTHVEEIHYSISSDGGESWSGQTGDQFLSRPGGTNAIAPAIAIDSQDVIHVVWSQDYQGNPDEIFYARSFDGGTTWTSQPGEVIISYPDDQSATDVDIAIGPNDEIYVIWKEADDSLEVRGIINLSISTDGGETWSGTTADTPITQSFTILLYPHIAIDSNGAIHVIWKGTQDESSPFQYEVYYSGSMDNGATWSGSSTDKIISYYQPGDPSINIPNMGVDHQGNVMVVWDEDYLGSDNEIFISSSSNGGITWSGETGQELVSFPDGHPAYRPFIVAGIDDTLHVTWNEVTTSSYYQIHYSRGAAIEPGNGVTLTFTPATTPIIIPASGGSFDFNALIENGGDLTQFADVWIMLQLPDSSWFGPLLGPVNLELPPGALIDRDRSQSIPGNAPMGIYLYEGRIGTYPDDIWYSSSFTFEKVNTSGSKDIDDWANTGESFQNELMSGDVFRIPSTPSIVKAYPNPFNPVTTISFELTEPSRVILKIYDLNGREVTIMIDGYRATGRQRVNWDAS